MATAEIICMLYVRSTLGSTKVTVHRSPQASEPVKDLKVRPRLCQLVVEVVVVVVRDYHKRRCLLRWPLQFRREKSMTLFGKRTGWRSVLGRSVVMSSLTVNETEEYFQSATMY